MQERFRLLGDQNFRSLVIADLGFLLLEQGDLYQAHTYLEESLATARELGNKDSIVLRLAELGNAFYLAGHMEEFKQNYRESFLLGKELGTVTKRGLLMVVLDSTHNPKPENSTHILGAIDNSTTSIHPLWKRHYDRAETHARKLLGSKAFESAFVDGQKMSLDEALDLALKTVDEM